VDVEAFDKDHSLLTQIGIAYLGHSLWMPTAPYGYAYNWGERVETRFIRVKEHKYLRNAYCPTEDSCDHAPTEELSLDVLHDEIKREFFSQGRLASKWNLQ